MLAVFDFIPHFCPFCGNPLPYKILENQDNIRDYNAFASASCNICSLKFQKTVERAILNAADEVGGDMCYYHER